jgi:hypothetical protein
MLLKFGIFDSFPLRLLSLAANKNMSHLRQTARSLLEAWTDVEADPGHHYLMTLFFDVSSSVVAKQLVAFADGLHLRECPEIVVEICKLRPSLI